MSRPKCYCNLIDKQRELEKSEKSKVPLKRLVMPIILDDGKKWDKTVPFSMLSEEQAKKNHGQTLKRLAERGGLSPSEAIAIINGGGWIPVSDKIGLEILNHRTNGEKP